MKYVLLPTSFFILKYVPEIGESVRVFRCLVTRNYQSEASQSIQYQSRAESGVPLAAEVIEMGEATVLEIKESFSIESHLV